MVWEVRKVDCFKEALGLLPEHLRKSVQEELHTIPEQLRLRCGRPVSVSCRMREYPLATDAVTERDIGRVLEKATCASVHSAVATMRSGFVPYKGLRIGICGTAILKSGEVCGFSKYGSLAIRIPAPFVGSLAREAAMLCKNGFANTLIVSPPGGGKTTALREIVRLVSDMGHTVGVVDERDEIFGGRGYETGAHTDVLTGTDKQGGVMMLLRTMGPEIIALDEISRSEDIKAAEEIFGCGVGIIATAHGSGVEDMKKREEYRRLFDRGVFRYILEVSADESGRCYALTELER